MIRLQREMFHRGIIYLLGTFSVFVFYGCASIASVGPDYVKPDISMNSNWHSPLENGINDSAINQKDLASWWTVFNDQELTSLINRAVANNFDLKKAEARIHEARALRNMARAGYYPTVDASGSGNRSGTSEDSGSGITSNFFSLGFDASWELDVFGGVRRSVEAADASLQSTVENRRDVLVSLLAEVALNYLEARTYQARIDVMESNLKSQDETLQLTEWRNQAGLTDELAVQQAKYNRETTLSELPPLRANLEKSANRIAVLLGEQPGKVHDEIMKQQPIPVAPSDIAVGVPADVIRQRPDVRKAERDLASQTAQIGVATAELYPKFTLNGSIGLEALSVDSLFSAGNQTASGGGLISWRIFEAGSIRQSIKVQTALQEQYLCDYETTVLETLEEVENALVAYAQEQNRKKALIQAVQSAQLVAKLAQYKYQSGLTDFTDVLVAERSLLSLQDDLAQSEGNITMDVVRLYKAFGGGWTSEGTKS
jgi:outer membrane protein, multidrug efflux system